MVAIQPTLKNIKIRSVSDAHLVFYAVARTILPLITRRLREQERKAIVAGNVYVWQDGGMNTQGCGPDMGMERWTDGMVWNSSRFRDGFLFYNQKDSDFSEGTDTHLSSRRKVINASQMDELNNASEAERLIKQTYSVFVTLPTNQRRGRSALRKWNLTAYFTENQLASLSTVDEIPGVGDADVPDGWFRSVRPEKKRRNHHELSHQISHTLIDHPASKDPTLPVSDLLRDRKRFIVAKSHPSALSNAVPGNCRSGPCSTDTSDLAWQKSLSLSPSNCVPPVLCRQLPPLHDPNAIAYHQRYPTDELILRRFSGCPFSLCKSQTFTRSQFDA